MVFVHDTRHRHVLTGFQNVLLQAFGSLIDLFEDGFGVANDSLHRGKCENIVKQILNDVRKKCVPNGRERFVVNRLFIERIVVLVGLHDDSIALEIHSFHE